jgi:hypothetical protein
MMITRTTTYFARFVKNSLPMRMSMWYKYYKKNHFTGKKHKMNEKNSV